MLNLIISWGLCLIEPSLQKYVETDHPAYVGPLSFLHEKKHVSDQILLPDPSSSTPSETRS